MRFTIERIRTLVLVAGVLLVVALGAFLTIGKYKNLFKHHDLPKRLGIDIQQEANSVTYTQSHGGHTLYKIHASKVVQLKQGNAVLHDVKIELYGEDGSRVDRIEGDEFEYNQKIGIATAAGPVDITLMRPGTALAIAPKATPGQVVSKNLIAKPLATAAETAASGEIHVKTSGLTFDQNSGVATTTQRVDFSTAQGTGSSTGASYDSQKGILELDRSVELTTRRAGEAVHLQAQHAEFTRDSLTCNLHTATADYRDGQATAGDAKILFRQDGSAVRLDAIGGFAVTTATGGHLAAPTGSIDFDEHNQPRHGHLEGGVTMNSVSETAGRRREVNGISPSAELEFTDKGELRQAHLERGVQFDSQELTQQPANTTASGPLRESRTWKSPIADVDFRDNGHGQAEPARIHGTQGVVIAGQTQHGASVPAPSRLTADDITGDFGPGSALTAMTGTGHASIEETNATGTRQSSTGDRLEAHFAPAGAGAAKPEVGAVKLGAGAAKPDVSGAGKRGPASAAQVQSAVLDGHVVLIQEPASKPGQAPQPPMHATAGRAVYEGTGEWLHLTLSPRVEDGGLQLSADKIDVSQESGDAFAHGNVKATWLDNGSGKTASGGQSAPALGGQGPAHVIATDAHLDHAAAGASGEATFTGHARLWQQANSVAGPLIILNRQKQTLVARSTNPAEPVVAVLVNPANPAAGPAANHDTPAKTASPSVIRVRGGDLKYSDADRKAFMIAGSLGAVVAETANATSTSNEVDLTLLPTGNHAGKSIGQGQVDRMTATGHVVLTSQGRRGTGEQLVYTSENGEYVLTGTAATFPRMTDPARGSVTGEALIFHSRDDSVSIEGGGRKTTTETTAPR